MAFWGLHPPSPSGVNHRVSLISFKFSLRAWQSPTAQPGLRLRKGEGGGSKQGEIEIERQEEDRQRYFRYYAAG